ncbi:MAG TPA: 4-(cytidine 5'-diphospho)-2-C-methyl-D-erythritol kinase [Chitinophagaceae bacterium]|nr:4-(cytidine 5'-diphospho)-2-C-methyl-D-erythritol kinase [Chitinophagaceae bacterium]
MIVFPPCKINLGLNILRQRSDRYHDLETVFYPVGITDILEITKFKSSAKSTTIPLTQSGLSIGSESVQNLCTKAYKLLKKDFPKLPFISIHLHKTIPAGAGLGGGSSDAAYTLKLLNDQFKLKLNTQQLMAYALELGSDCPFFILNQPCYATGRGELTEPVAIDLSAYQFLLVYPGIHIDTGQAFRSIKPSKPGKPLKEILNSPIERWKDDMTNSFEKQAFRQYPEIVDIKDHMYAAGAVYASMSGSGSTVYGIFEKDKKHGLTFPPHYFVKEVSGKA